MSELENRISKLEKRVDPPEGVPTLVLLEDEPLPLDTPENALIIRVVSQEAKQNTEAILRGVCTEKEVKP